MIRKGFNIFFKTVFAIAVLSFAANAATLAEYRDNIQHFKEDLNSLIVPDADWTDEQEQKFIREVSEELPELFPSKQKIEFAGTTVETENDWIINKFSSFKDLKNDAPERDQILAELYERLAAVEQKITELENAAVSDRTKDEEKQKLAEILSRAEYSKPEKQDESAIAAAYRRFMRWLRSLFSRADIAPPNAPEGFQAIPFFLQILIYALVIGLIGFLIYKFAPFLINRIKTRERREKSERVILGEKIAADATSENLFGDAERMAREGDLRGAIRKGYIAFLCELSDRKIIGLSKNKTNRDYLRDVRKRRELFQNMNGLTNNYERHWYGFQEADETDWNEFKDDYQKAIKSN